MIFQNSFQSIFRAADSLVGYDRPVNIEQNDTSAFDEINDDDDRRVKIKYLEPDLYHLQNSSITILEKKPLFETRRLFVHKSEIAVEKDKLSLPKLSVIQCYDIPKLEWEKEVYSIMSNNTESSFEVEELEEDGDANNILSSRGSTKKNNHSSIIYETPPISMSCIPPSLQWDNISFLCFDNNLVNENDLTNIEQDDFDVLIPNTQSYETGNQTFDDDDDINNNEENEYNNNINHHDYQTLSINQNNTSINQNNTINNTTATTELLNENELNNINDSNLIPKTKAEKDKLMMEEKVKRLSNATIGGHDAAASIILKSLSGNKRPRDDMPQIRNRLKSMISTLNHNIIATTHKNTKMDLTEMELRYFHRPRMAKSLKIRQWHINIIKNENTNKLKNNHNHTIKSFNENKPNSLSLLHGDFVLIEYIEELPPILLNLGMASAILNYYKNDNSNSNNNENEENNISQSQNSSKNDKYEFNLLQPQHESLHTITNKSISNNRSDNNNFQSFKISNRLPRHMQLLLKQKNNKYYNQESNSNIPKLEYGDSKLLDGETPSPFLGDLLTNEVLQSLSNNLFRCPLFLHKPKTSDFLLIRCKLENKLVTYSLREIPVIFLAGQIEPQKIVPKPSRNITKLQEKMLLLSAARYFRTFSEPVSFNEVINSLLKFYYNKTCFRDYGLKKLIKDKIAEEIPLTKKWKLKETYEKEKEKLTNNEIQELERTYTPDELEKNFSPEDVCLQESCNSVEWKLHELGIDEDVDLAKIKIWLERMKRLKDYRIDRVARIKILCNDVMSNNSTLLVITRQTTDPAVLERITLLTKKIQNYQKLIKILTKEIQHLEHNVEIGQFVYERLLVASWNTTETFVHSHLERDGLGRMDLTGQGDPSGRGEGFAYVRVLRPQSQAGGSAPSKKTVQPLVHTDKDLRRLTKSDLLRILKGFGLSEDKVRGLKRWDQVHLVREHSTKAEKSGIASAMHKYARGSAEDINATKQESFKEQCQKIWLRQRMALMKQQQYQTNVAVDSLTAEDSESDDCWDDEEQLGMEEDIERTIARKAKELMDQDKIDKENREQQADKEDENELLSLRHSMVATTPTNSKSVHTLVKENSRTKKQKEPMAEEKKLLMSIEQTEQPKQLVPPGDAGEAVVTGEVKKTNKARKRKLGAPSGPPTLPAAVVVGTRGTEKPTRVVKRLERIIQDDGTECVTISFILSDIEVIRVEQNAERDLKLKNRSWSRSQDLYDDDEDTNGLGKVNITDGKNQIMKGNGKDENLKIRLPVNKTKMDKAAPHRDGRGHEDEDSYGYNAPKGTSRLSGLQPTSYRMPHIRFAAKLEKELMEEWRKKHAMLFRNPVPISIEGYYDRIKTPICLLDIRNKIAQFVYLTVQDFLIDVQLIVKNAEEFNGKASPVSNDARCVYSNLRLILTHDLKHLGAEKDEYSVLETAVKKKYLHWRRPISGYVPVFRKPEQPLIIARLPPVEPLPVPAPALVPAPAQVSVPVSTLAPAPAPVAVSAPAPVPVPVPAARPPTPPPPISHVSERTLVDGAGPTVILSQPLSQAMDDDSSGDEEVLEEG